MVNNLTVGISGLPVEIWYTLLSVLGWIIVIISLILGFFLGKLSLKKGIIIALIVSFLIGVISTFIALSLKPIVGWSAAPTMVISFFGICLGMIIFGSLNKSIFKKTRLQK